MVEQKLRSGYSQIDDDPSPNSRWRFASIARRPGFTGLLLASVGIVAVLGTILGSQVNRQLTSQRIVPAMSGRSIPATANPISLQAQEWGVAACLHRVAALSNFLVADVEFRWLAARGPNPSEESFVATIATRRPDGSARGVSVLHAAPIGSGGCNTSYSSTIHFAKSCRDVHDNFFRAFAHQINFGSAFADAYATSDGGGRLFLFDTGVDGCVAVMTETFY